MSADRSLDVPEPSLPAIGVSLRMASAFPFFFFLKNLEAIVMQIVVATDYGRVPGHTIGPKSTYGCR